MNRRVWATLVLVVVAAGGNVARVPDALAKQVQAGGSEPVAVQGLGRVVRGGCWSVEPQHCRSANRFRRDPSYRSSFVGFRLARSPSGKKQEQELGSGAWSGGRRGGAR